MLRNVKIIFSCIFIIFLIISCDDYCGFQFSEEFFPLEVGNTWSYSNYQSSGSFERWEIVDKINDSGIEKYKLERSDRNGKVLSDGFFYYSGKKLYSTLPFYMEWIGSDYILADFSLNEGDIYNLDFEDYRVIVISKKQNSITFGYIPNDTWLDFPDLQITFDKGIGITEYYYFESQGKQILADYLIN